ncbi:MAG: DUF3793 family protein [Clostridium sp.]|uniref:DUF3793 family protein n=1 Tax=Clostridium sp. TaxID=1506 RepID=UPI003EE6A25D
MSEKILDFYVDLKNMNTRETLEKYLLFTLAPVISGDKPSSTITLKVEKEEYSIWLDIKEEFLEASNLKEVSLRENEKAIIILIYNEENLLNCLNENRSKKFMENLGYNLNLRLENNLIRLIERYEEYHCPHELGIFLGIPLDDVQDFMECTNKKCLLCGYWKVFNDYEKSKSVFDRYDNSKIIMIDIINDEINLKKRILEFNKRICA